MKKFFTHARVFAIGLGMMFMPAIVGATNVNNLLSANNSTFEDGTVGDWNSWGNNSERAVATPGYLSNYCLKLTNPSAGSDYYSAQACLEMALEQGKTYILKFMAKTDKAGSAVQICYQNSETYDGGGYKEVQLTTDWAEYETTITIDKANMNRVLINFGKYADVYYIDKVEFGEEAKGDVNPGGETTTGNSIITGNNSTFEEGTLGDWNSWGNSSERSVGQPGYNSSYCLQLTNPSAGSDYYVAQSCLEMPLEQGKTYTLKFMAKGSAAGMAVQACFQNSETYAGGGYVEIPVTTEWAEYQAELTIDQANMNRVLINFGKYAGTYYIDNVQLIDPTASSIRQVENTNIQNVACFNLAGQRVSRAAKGIVIINGKKMLNK